MRTFDDHDQLSRVSFDETTLERAIFDRDDVRKPFRLRSIEVMDQAHFLREIIFWQRYTRTEEDQINGI